MRDVKPETQDEAQGFVQYRSFRLYLQAELLRRCEKNPNYSLRSFARSLNINHSALSRILSGKRGFSQKMFLSLAQALNLGTKDIETFSRESFGNERAGIQDLTVDAFTIISEWYHDAILELMRLESFRSDSKWIAKTIGITVSEVNSALERLERLGLIEKTSKGKWTSHVGNTEVGIETPYTTVALKKYQKQILQMAIGAIDSVPKERRHNISGTAAIDSRDLVEIKNRINKFRRQLERFMQREGTHADQVYELGICFYPITQDKELL